MKSILIETHSSEETCALGRRAAALLKPGDVLALSGGLGAGKTTFVKGVVQGLGGTCEATSPTFVLMHEYSGEHILYHIDVYRLRDSDEAREAGLEELIHAGDAVVLVEWADRVIEMLPAHCVTVRFSVAGDNERAIVFEGGGERFDALRDGKGAI